MSLMGLPGNHRGKEETHCCDCGKETFCNLIQGETDSFGYEVNAFCNECLGKLREEAKNATDTCDWCDKEKQKCVWTRDYDEGSYGPAYHVCRECYKKQMEYLRKEEAKYRDKYYY